MAPSEGWVGFIERPAAVEPPPAEEFGDPRRNAYAFLRGIIDECMRAGRLVSAVHDPDLGAQAAWAAVHGVVALHAARSPGEPIAWRPARQLAAAVIDAFIRGVTPSSTDAPPQKRA